jgi:hypothetical protein
MAKRLRGVDPIERFNTKYVVDEETGCWLWQDKLLYDGYGRLQVNGKNIKAHRFSYEYFIGPLDENLVICHKCSNRNCVMPDHLRQDTQKSNAIDMVKIKKQHIQILSVEEVIEIKKALKQYYRGQCNDLAHYYKVNKRTISSIKKGISWSHVEID